MCVQTSSVVYSSPSLISVKSLVTSVVYALGFFMVFWFTKGKSIDFIGDEGETLLLFPGLLFESELNSQKDLPENEEVHNDGNPIRKLSALTILPYLSFLYFNLGTIALCVILGIQYKTIDEDTEHYLTLNA